MKHFLRDIWVIGRYELSEAVRSRRAVVLLVLFVAGGMLACNSVVSSIHKAESEIAEALGLPTSSSAGIVTDALWKHKVFRRIMSRVIGDRQVAMELLSVPPMAMVFAFLAFTFTPLLVMLTTSSRISEEIGTGSVRYVAVRTSRLAWIFGKFLGQSFMLIVALMLSAAGAWCIFRFRLADMDILAMSQAMVVYAWKVWLYSLAFVGLAIGVSQVTRSANKAMCLGYLIWFGLTVLSIMGHTRINHGAAGQAWQLVLMLIPMGHRMDMWRLDIAHQVQGAFFLISLGMMYMMAGYAFLSRKDI